MSKVKLHEYQYDGKRFIKLNERMRKGLKFFNYTNVYQWNNKKKSNKISWNSMGIIKKREEYIRVWRKVFGTNTTRQ